jgi:very-short-patch-repair endonuclease
MSNNFYNKNLKSFARGLRNESTKAEVKIWCDLLRRKQMRGYQFLRQRAIGNYITDFFCKELKLVIEIDGITHHHEDTHKKDAQKEIALKELGYSVLRFSDEDVLDNINGVKIVIEEWIRENASSPLPPSKGEV